MNINTLKRAAKLIVMFYRKLIKYTINLHSINVSVRADGRTLTVYFWQVNTCNNTIASECLIGDQETLRVKHFVYRN